MRALIAGKMRQRGALVGVEDIFITAGAGDALAVAVEASGVTQVQVGYATSPGALDVFEAQRCAASNQPGLPARYVMPAVCNPHGATMGAEMRRTCLEANVIFEDDALGELHFEGLAPHPLVAEAADRVFFIGSFSKTLTPELKIGWLIAPRWAHPQVAAALARRPSPSLVAQSVVEQLLAAPEYESRLGKLRAHYAERCERMVRAMSRVPGVRFGIPTGGFSLWVETDFGGEDDAWLRFAIEHGVAFDPGGLFRCSAEPHAVLAMRLSFSSVPIEHIEEGVLRLSRALGEVHRRSVSVAA